MDLKNWLSASLVPLIAIPAAASGTLLDNGVLVLSFSDASGITPISGENDGTYIWTAGGGGSNYPLARYSQAGTLDIVFFPGPDFRSIYTDDAGNLFAKEYGAGDVWSITQAGTGAILFTLNDLDSQSSAGLNGDDTELYTMSIGQIRRYNAANGAPLRLVHADRLGSRRYRDQLPRRHPDGAERRGPHPDLHPGNRVGVGPRRQPRGHVQRGGSRRRAVSTRPSRSAWIATGSCTSTTRQTPPGKSTTSAPAAAPGRAQRFASATAAAPLAPASTTAARARAARTAQAAAACLSSTGTASVIARHARAHSGRRHQQQRPLLPGQQHNRRRHRHRRSATASAAAAAASCASRS